MTLGWHILGWHQEWKLFCSFWFIFLGLMWFDFILFRGKGIEWLHSWRSPVSFSVWLQLTHVAERNMWQHLQSLQRILLLHCTLLMYFSQVYFLIVFLNCISQVYFSRGQLKHVTTYAVYATDPSSLLVNQTFSRFFLLLLSQWNMFHTQFDCLC